jgi:hypothetical protein
VAEGIRTQNGRLAHHQENGRLENYRSNLELVPSLLYDVEVLP